jgi:hypothetical protein
VEHLGISYEVKMGIGQNQWVWIAHTSRPRSGRVTGSRQQAVSAARKAIQSWCYQHPTHCGSDDAAAAAP